MKTEKAGRVQILINLLHTIQGTLQEPAATATLGASVAIAAYESS